MTIADIMALTGTLEKTVLGTIAVKSNPIIEVDVTCYGGEDPPAEPPPKPILRGAHKLNEAVLDGDLPMGVWFGIKGITLLKRDQFCYFLAPKSPWPENMACLYGAR